MLSLGTNVNGGYVVSGAGGVYWNATRTAPVGSLALRTVGLRAVEQVEYEPYGRPAVLARDLVTGAPTLSVVDEASPMREGNTQRRGLP